MAPQTQFPSPVDNKLFRIFRVIQGGAMAVLTLYDFVLRCHVCIVFFLMALAAVIFGLVLYLEVFPFILTADPVKAVHEAAFSNAEVGWYDQRSYSQNQGHNNKDNPQWT